MKKRIIPAIVFAAAALAAPFALAQEGATAAPPQEAAAPKAPHRRWEDLALPPLRQFTAAKPERRVIDGMVVYLLEDHELPTIDLVALVRAGAVYETRDKAGLAAITGEVMRTGGTAARPGDALDEQLESMGAAVEVAVSRWQAQAVVSSLKECFESSLAALVDVIENPAFPEAKIALAKKQHRSAIARRNDEPHGIASREFARAIYGDASPYGWTEETATIDAITRADLVAFHDRFFRRDRTIVGVVGDFKTEEMAALIEKAFAGYKKADAPLPPAPEVGDGPPPRAYLVRKPELNQSTVVLGHMSIQRRPEDPDYCPAVVADTILGRGGFASRLMQHVRTELGLAYSVWSTLDAPYSHKGTFTMSCQTKSASTLQAIATMKKELAALCAEAPTAEELRVAKESILQSLVFASESRRDVIERALRYEYYGFPQDYLEKFQAGIAAVSADDVLRVARKLFHPDRLTAVVVGNDADFGSKIEPAVGPVTMIDVTRPAWPQAGAGELAATRAPSPEAKARAAAVIAQAVEAHGGKAALEAVRAIRARGKLKMSQGGQEMEMAFETLIAYPDRMKMVLMTPMGSMTQCLDGQTFWLSLGGQSKTGGPSEVAKARAGIDGTVVAALLGLAGAKEAALADEPAEVGGAKALVVLHGGQKFYFDEATHRLVRRDDASGETTTYADFRPVAGVLLPFQESGSEEGADLETRFEELVANPEVPADAFARPAGAGQ